MKHKYLFAILYSIFLIIFTTFCLLDTFVITKVDRIVENNSSTNYTDDEIQKLLENAIVTENSYEDKNIKIEINTMKEYNTTIYIADIQISSIEYLKTAFAQNSYGRNVKATTSATASDNIAILAINGDYYGFRNNGFVLRNGVIYRSTKQSDSCEDLVIYKDGTFEIVNELDSNINSLLENGALQVFSFGPGLIKNGSILVDEDDEVSQSMTSNPRTAIGYIDSLHYVFAVSDGRTSESEGLTLYNLAMIMKNYGCTEAYNLDGGGSSTMYFNGQIVNNPTDGHSDGERSVSDIVYIGY